MSEADPREPTAGHKAAPRPTRRWTANLGRYAFVPILLALVFVVLHGGLGLGRDTTPLIHSLRNLEACAECHPSETDPALTASEPELCIRCHKDAVHKGPNHPWYIPVTTNTDPRVPLFDGKMTCSTCHDPHGKTGVPKLLRRPGDQLCLACHKDQGTGHHGKMRKVPRRRDGE